MLVVCEKLFSDFFFFRAVMVEEWEIFCKFRHPSDARHDSLLVYNFYKFIRQQTDWQGQIAEFMYLFTKFIKNFSIFAPVISYQIQQYMKKWHQSWSSLLVVKNTLFEIFYFFHNLVEKFNFVCIA